MLPRQSFLCLVINLDGSDDRWRSVSTQLTAADISFERLPAADGRLVPPENVADYDADGALRYMGRGLVGGEIGCYHSHLAAARRFLETDKAHCLVIEDDAQPDPHLRRVVDETIAFLDTMDSDWRVVNLGNNKLKIATEQHAITTDADRYALFRAFYFPMTTGALLWSRKGAADFVENHFKIFAPIDNYLRHWITRAGGGYAFHPRPVETTDAESDIANVAQAPRSKHNRNGLYGLRKQRRLLLDKMIAVRNKRKAGKAPAAKGA